MMVRRLSLKLTTALAVTLVVLFAALTACAQTQSKIPHIGYIWLGAEGSDRATTLPGFQQGLRELGYQQGRDIVIDYSYADGSVERLRELVSHTVASKVDVIVAPGVIVADAVKSATRTIPVVALVGDPLASGLVASLARPGGNVTGFSSMWPDLGGKFIELVHELVPHAARVAMLWNPSNGASRDLMQAMREPAGSLGLSLLLYETRRPADFPIAFGAITEQNPDALVIDTDVLLISHRKSIVEFAAERRLPSVYGLREFVVDGGLISYGSSSFDLSRRVAGYVDKILKGAKPADLPVEQPTKFELVLNLKTAKALGLTIPPMILARSDEVLE